MSEAKVLVDSIVEHAREVFAETIAELLMPHYRLLEQHLGLESPVGRAKPNTAATKERPVSAGGTSPPGKKKNDTSAKAPKKKPTAKTTAASRRTKKATPCRKQ